MTDKASPLARLCSKKKNPENSRHPFTEAEDSTGILQHCSPEQNQKPYAAISPDPWEPISVSRVEFPDMILEDMALFFADIHVQWREVSWWLCRIHHASTTSAPNYVVVTERDYEPSVTDLMGWLN